MGSIGFRNFIRYLARNVLYIFNFNSKFDMFYDRVKVLLVLSCSILSLLLTACDDIDPVLSEAKLPGSTG